MKLFSLLRLIKSIFIVGVFWNVFIGCIWLLVLVFISIFFFIFSFIISWNCSVVLIGFMLLIFLQDVRSQCLFQGRRWIGYRWYVIDVWCIWGICFDIRMNQLVQILSCQLRDFIIKFCQQFFRLECFLISWVFWQVVSIIMWKLCIVICVVFSQKCFLREFMGILSGCMIRQLKCIIN